MAQLTYWSLQQYDHLPVVRSARKAMCKQMTDMFLEQYDTALPLSLSLALALSLLHLEQYDYTPRAITLFIRNAVPVQSSSTDCARLCATAVPSQMASPRPYMREFQSPQERNESCREGLA